MPIKVGSIVEGKVSGITNFGAFIELDGGGTGLVHISEVADDYVKDIKQYLKAKQEVKVKVLSIDGDGKVSLSIRQAQPPKKKSNKPQEVDWSKEVKKEPVGNLEDKISRFLKDSEEKMQTMKAKTNKGRKGNGYNR